MLQKERTVLQSTKCKPSSQPAASKCAITPLQGGLYLLLQFHVLLEGTWCFLKCGRGQISQCELCYVK